MEEGGRPFVLAEHHPALREMAIHRLHDPESFWDKLESFPTVKTVVPPVAMAALRRALPGRDLPTRILHRTARLRSLGRPRLVAIAPWRGCRVPPGAEAPPPSPRPPA